MFAIDLTPEINTQGQQVVIAQSLESSAQDTKAIGVCALPQNPISPIGVALNGISPTMALSVYFRKIEGKYISYENANTIIVENPKHGPLEQVEGGFIYRADGSFLGDDYAVFDVTAEGVNVKVNYFIDVLPAVSGDMYEDPEYCPKGFTWKIALSTNEIPAQQSKIRRIPESKTLL